MDTLNHYRELIERIITDYASIPYSHGDIQRLPVFDRERDHYLLVIAGWDPYRVHGCILHVDIIDGISAQHAAKPLAELPAVDGRSHRAPLDRG